MTTSPFARVSASTWRGRATSAAAAVAVAAAGLVAGAAPASAAPIALAPTDSFPSTIDSTRTGLTFDGSDYWEVSGGSTSGVRLARLNAAGDAAASYSPGVDFRAISAGPDGTVYSSAFSSAVVSTVDGDGSITPLVTLDGAIEMQSDIIINEAGNRFLTHDSGTVRQWNLDGTLAETIVLQGWTGTPGALSSVHIAQTAGLFLAADPSAEVVRAWDATGTPVADFSLADVSLASTEAQVSLSAFDGTLAVSDGGTWNLFRLTVVTVGSETTVAAGSDLTASATVVDTNTDRTGETVTFSVYAGDTCTGEPVASTTGTVADGEAAAEAIQITAAGQYQWVAAVGDLSSRCGAAPFTVTPAALETLEISPVTAEIAFDASQEYTATGADAFDNPIAEPAGVIYTVDGGTCTDNVCSAQPGTHTVTATSGDVTATATLVVNPEAPAVVTSPADSEVLTGGDASFTVVASGGDAAVQWQSSTDGETWTDIDGATEPTLTIAAVTPQLDGSSYRAVLSNSTGTATSESAALTVPPVGLTLTDASGASVMAGDTLVEGESVTAEVDTLAPDTTVTMTLESEPTVVGTPISGASGVASATFDVPAIGAGAHTFVVTDSSGTVLATLALMVEAAAVPEGPDAPVVTEPAVEGDELSQTGADVWPALAIALATAIAGAMLVLTERRRTHA